MVRLPSQGPLPADAEVRPLVRATMPRPDESLVGLIARATDRNVLGNLRIILEEVGIALPRPGAVGQVIDTEQLARLASKVGCDPEELSSKLHPYIGEEGASALVSWHGQLLRRSHLELSRRRISPATLQSQEHHSALWLLEPLAYCPLSFERLIDRCGECQQPLGWVAARGIGVCEHCRQVVRHPDGETLPEDLQAGYTSFARLLSICPAIRDNRLAELPAGLRCLQLHELINLAFNLGRALTSARRRSIADEGKPFSDAHATAKCFAVAAPLLDGWPMSVRARLGEIADDPACDHLSTLRLIRRLGHKNYKGPTATIVRKAFPELFGSGRHTLKALQASVMNPLALMIKGGFTSAQYAKLRDGEFLGDTAPTGSVRTSIHFSRAVADDLIEAKRGSEGMSKLAQALGLPRYAVEQLICLGEVQHVYRPAFSALGFPTRITSASREAFVKDLILPEASAPAEALSLVYLMRRFTGAEKPWGSVLKMLRAGALRFWLNPNSRYRNGRAWPLVRRMLVLPSDFAQASFALFEIAAFPNFEFEHLISQQDALEVLAAKHSMLGLAFAKREIEILPGWGKAQAASRKAVTDLARHHVSAAEISHWLDLSGNHGAVRAMRRFPDVRRRSLGWLRSDCELHLPGFPTRRQ